MTPDRPILHNTAKSNAEETVDIRRVLRTGEVTHDLMSRATAELITVAEDGTFVKSLRIQSLADYLKEIKNT